jgi:UDP-N-acetyl-D-galactosamine dehydrogenase
MNKPICIVGCGYVGFQLALTFQKHLQVYCVDINEKRINDYKNGIDKTGTVEMCNAWEELKGIIFETDIKKIPSTIDTFIVCVPTPVDKNHKPDLTATKSATRSVAGVLKKGDLVVFESTVAPFTTERVCVPILKESGLEYQKDFVVGYSPERLQPGIGGKTILEIVKLVSGCNKETLDRVYDVYNTILPDNMLHRCNTMVEAELSKLLENINRDVNIALMNQFKLICDRYGVDFDAVIHSAETKFNYNQDVTYGMVGGHCIGVDPYYLIDFCQQDEDFYDKTRDILLTARNINEYMPFNLAKKVDNALGNAGKGNVTIVGFTFKENCSDTRNTKAYDLYQHLIKMGYTVKVYDPKADVEEAKHLYNVEILQDEMPNNNDAIVITLKDREIIDFDPQSKLVDGGAIVDFKNVLTQSVKA